MPKLKLLILDANVVIFLFENGLWQQVLARCEIHLSRIVAEDEVRYYHGRDADKLIDLSDDVTHGRVHLFDLAPSDLKQFVDQFDPLYLDRLDPGESESLAFLVLAKEEYLISSADAIVFKVLGNLNRGHQGISVEEVLQQIGQSRSKIPRQYSKQFKESYTKEGEQDSIRGRGKKPSK
jgi:hypothetical protein